MLVGWATYNGATVMIRLYALKKKKKRVVTMRKDLSFQTSPYNIVFIFSWKRPRILSLKPIVIIKVKSTFLKCIMSMDFRLGQKLV